MQIQCFALKPFSADCYIVTEPESGETAVIDCGELTEEFYNNLKGKNLKYILLTHGHADHILGVYELKKRFPEAKIVIHSLDAECLGDDVKSLCTELLPGAQKYIEADITVNEGDKLSLGSSEIFVMHTPGHTMGSVCYYFTEERVIFTGDTLFCLTVGRTDFYGGSDEQMYDSIKRLYDMEGDYEIYPGHNRSTTMNYERQRNRFMRKFK